MYVSQIHLIQLQPRMYVFTVGFSHTSASNSKCGSGSDIIILTLMDVIHYTWNILNN